MLICCLGIFKNLFHLDPLPPQGRITLKDFDNGTLVLITVVGESK